MSDIVQVRINGYGRTEVSLSLITFKEIHEFSILNESSDKRVMMIIQGISKGVSDNSSCLTILKFKGLQSSFGDKGATAIAAALPKILSLTELDIEANFGNRGAIALCEAVAVMPNIHTINLWSPFTDDGMEAVISMIARTTTLKRVLVRLAEIESKTYQHLLTTLKYNTSIKTFGFPRGSGYFKTLPLSWLDDCFSVNSTLTHAFIETISEPIRWYTCRNAVCEEINGANGEVDGQKLRASVPREARSFEEMKEFSVKFIKEEAELAYLREEVKRMQEEQMSGREVQTLLAQLTEEHEVELQQCRTSTKKELSKKYLDKAYNMLDQVRLSEAMCLLQCALELDESDEMQRGGSTLSKRIEDQMRLSEHEQQMQMESRMTAIKEEIMHAEEQARRVRSEEEAKMIKKQMDILHKQEKQLKASLCAHEARQKELEDRAASIETQERLLSEQTKQLEELLSELGATITKETTKDETAVLEKQMANVTAGDKDVEAARRRFASLQKAAREAQQRLKVEERSQQERVEWMQKQIELFKVKGMSPSQLSFRNFLKDVKRLSILRSLKDHTPHPLRCFISYAWETDVMVNKELQERLKRLKDELKVAGMEVVLDIRNMKDDMKKYMVQGIDHAHKVLLICTPRLKVRAAEDKQNNLKLELATAMEKAKSIPELIVPLVMSGTFSDAIPAEVGHLLSVNLTLQPFQKDHYECMASLAPMGLIPMLLGLEDNKDYQRIHDRLFGDLEQYANQSKV